MGESGRTVAERFKGHMIHPLLPSVTITTPLVHDISIDKFSIVGRED